MHRKNSNILNLIRNTYRNVRDLLPVEQMRQTIIAFTFLRRIDCLIGKYAQECAAFYFENRQRLSDERLDENLTKISGGYPFYNYSGYTFNGVLSTNYSIDTVLNSYLQGFSKNVLVILDGLNFKHNVAILMRKSRYLVKLFQNFSEIDLSNKSINNEEFMNLIISFAAYNLKNKESYTPLNLANLICKCLLYDDTIANKTIYDPTCGTGSMLAIAGLIAKEKSGSQENVSLYGQEISEFSSAIAKIFVLFIGDEHSKIEHGNTLTDDMFSNRHFQYILADIPFGISWKPFKERIENEYWYENGRFSLGLPSERDSQFLFIEHIISKMDANGSRAAFITMESALWNGEANSGESRIRKWLFENDMVETIISLPSGALNYTGIKTCLWILSNRKKSFQKGHVRLIDTTTLTNGKKNVSIDSTFVDRVVSEYYSWTYSSMSTIVNNEQFGYYEVELLENDKRSERVKIALDTDINDFIRRERQPYAKGIITVNYSSAEKGYAVYFKPKEILPTPLKETTYNVSFIIDAITTLSPFIKQIDNLKDNKFNSNTWKEKPLRAFIEIIKGRRTEVEVIKTDVCIKVNGQNVGEVQKYPLPKSSVNYATLRCTNNELIASEYLYYLLKGYEKAFMSFGSGMVLKRIDTQAILDFKCLIPPIGEQMRIVSYLDSIVNKIDNIIKTLNSTDNTFTTFRQALIENVVQGKVKLT